MGHNSQRRAIRWPLTQIQYDRAMAAIRCLRDALATGVASRSAITTMKAAGKTLARTTAKLGRWLRIDKAADEFAKSFGKTAGPLAAAAIFGHVTGADEQLKTLIKMIWQWVGPN
jgi:hypothetical protein